MNRTSIPVMQGGLKLDRAVSDFDRPQRLTVAYLWAIPGPRSGWLRYPLGGWSLAGITAFQSGTPFTVANGSDRNNDAIPADRPDIGNPGAPLNSRAIIIIFPRCATGYQNPDIHALIPATCTGLKERVSQTVLQSAAILCGPAERIASI